MNNYFSNKIVWLTGGSSGIGLALSSEFIKKGAIVVVSSRRSTIDVIENNNKVNEIINNKNFHHIQMDVSKSDDVSESYQIIKQKYLTPDILINNAGIGIFKPMLEMNYDEFDLMMNTNVRGVLNTIKQVIPDMQKKGSGTIINISSVATEEKFLGSSVYAASKSAVRMMSKILREELRNDNIKIIDVIPGATATPIWNEKVLDKHGYKMMQP